MTHPTSGDQPAETLACRLTPPGEGGIGLIELEGPLALTILDPIFVNPRGLRASAVRIGRLLYGQLRRGDQPLDEVLLDCVRRRPWPDVVVNCHGGALASRRVLQAMTGGGAREVTWPELLARRAAAGLLDALRREAAEKIPRALASRAAATLLDQYGGVLARRVNSIIRLVERAEWSGAAQALSGLLATAPFGRGLCHPPTLVLAGRPNVGKSTLGNALLRRERMLVHHRPGTTRDTIEEMLAVAGIPFLLVDTAGIRTSPDEVEREGVERSLGALARSDAALLLFDASEPLQAEDARILAGPLPARLIPILNKCDLPIRLSPDEIRRATGRAPLSLSAASGEGLAGLEQRIIATVYPVIPAPGEAVLFTVRQEEILRSVEEAVARKAGADALALLRGLMRP